MSSSEQSHAIARVRAAQLAAEAVQFDLRRRQERVLDLEVTARRVRAGRTEPLVLVDQAEDARRGLGAHREEVPQIVAGLRTADVMATVASRSGDLAVDDARELTRSINLATQHAQRLAVDLEGADQALGRISRASAQDPALVPDALDQIGTATSMIERARRGTFNLVEELPDIERELARPMQQEAELPLNLPRPTPIGDRLRQPAMPTDTVEPHVGPAR